MFENNKYLSLLSAGLDPFDGDGEAFAFELNPGLCVTVYLDGTPAEYYNE